MFYEVALESRRWTQSRDNTEEVFVYEVCNEDLTEDDGEYGSFFTPNDDVGLAIFIYNNFPDFRVFATPTDNITLYIKDISVAEIQRGTWQVTLTYSPPDSRQLQENDPSYVQFGFSTNGDTVKTTRSISVVSGAARTDITTGVPETYGLIGASKNDIEGIDLSDAKLSFNITGYYDWSIWNTGVLTLMTTMSKRYNNNVFYGFPAGEVLLDSIEAQGEVLKVTPVTFNFLHAPNVNNVPDPPFPNLTALGHDYIDYRYVEETDANQLVQWPAFRYVHRVRQPGNFALLGI